MAKVLVVDDKPMMRDSVCATLVRAGLTAVAAGDGAAALSMLRKHRPAAVVTDLKMPEMDGLELLEAANRLDPDLPVILMTAFATVQTAVKALKDGAFDYIQKPFEGEELVSTVRRAVERYELIKENAGLKQGQSERTAGKALVGDSREMKQLRAQVEQIALSHGTVLVCGESGVGKEVVAQMVHAMSPRRDKVMLCLNCAALSASLLESELFGHERGAFTGAEQMRKGRFELAEAGTLLLDEISEVGPHVQAKLLRVLQERQFERVGSSVTMEVDVRIIATTNRDLRHEVAEGRFREDLYFRLNVLPIHVPPLRARKDDIPALADHFLVRQAARDGGAPKTFNDAAMRVLDAYDWPGNVRELENICERAAVVTRGQVIAAQTVEPWLTGRVGKPAPDVVTPDLQTLEDMEREMVLRALRRYDGHRARTAEALGIGLRTLGIKLKKWKDQRLVPETV